MASELSRVTVRARARRSGSEIANTLRMILEMVRDPGLFLWSFYLFLFPIYIFSSGTPQPGDWLILILGPVALRQWNGRLSPASVKTLRSLLIFTGYVILVNLAWSVVINRWSVSPKGGFALAPVFYLYNAVLFLVVLVQYRRHGENFFYLTAKIILATLLVQAALGVTHVGGGRATVMFNNPNQLGYYALLSASILIILQRSNFATTMEVALGSVAAIYLALLSASKAAVVSIIILAAVGMVTRLRTMLLIGALLGGSMLVASPMLDALTDAITRIETDDHLGFVEERGYDRILKYPEYWVLGSGEGAYYRFKYTTAIGAHEIHSSIGTLFFSYGIVGTVLYVAFILMVLKRTGLRTWLLILPSLAYGMTHQGLRFSLFWVQLALIVALREWATTKPRARSG